MEVPFIERQKRVSKRDILLKKGAMVLRDLVVRQSIKKGNRYKKIDMRITNTGDFEGLQQIADNIYNSVINEPSINYITSLQEKYGGYIITDRDTNVHNITSITKKNKNEGR